MKQKEKHTRGSSCGNSRSIQTLYKILVVLGLFQIYRDIGLLQIYRDKTTVTEEHQTAQTMKRNNNNVNHHNHHQQQQPNNHGIPDAVSLEWRVAMQQAEEMLDLAMVPKKADDSYSFDPSKVSCLLPDTAETQELANQRVAEVKEKGDNKRRHRNLRDEPPSPPSEIFRDPLVPFPILNLGMPKMGSTTLFRYFQCKGFDASHWKEGTSTNQFEGLCMRDAVRIGLPPLATCSSGKQAIMQMDYDFPIGFTGRSPQLNYKSPKFRDDCFFPQLSLLEELHDESPHATFVLNFRPIHDWIKSVKRQKLMDRFQACHLPNLPFGVPNMTGGKRGKALEATISQFFCSHVLHVRNFVKAHPSHKLIELDLYNTTQTVNLLDQLFPSLPNANANAAPPKSCWEQSNKSF